MPPPKEHFFNIRTPPGTSVGEAIDAMEALVAIEEIYSVQHHGGFDFQAGVNSIQAAQDLLETGCLRLGTRVDPLVPVARQVASVTCLYLLCYVPDNEVATSLKSFGTTLRKEKARYKDRNSLRMGARYISWRIHSRILHEWAARPTFEYRGRSVPALRRRPRQRRLHRKKNMWYDSGDGRGRVSDTSHGAPYRADTKETNYPATGKANQAERRQRRAGTARHSRKKRQCKPRHWRGRKEEGKEGFTDPDIDPEDIRTRRSKCRRRRAKWQCFRLGFLNLHGARRKQKWGELYNALREEEFSVYAVAETHLRDLEEPPIQPDWHWTGQNRCGQSRKGGGSFTQASVDGHLDANGKLLLQLAEDLDLVIVNLGPQW
ncbi:hypothetical protein HPB52_022543 [Rhipicephalus sanguineus]|uniref:Endonuclease/exonuclease/phosphatase domain-containing protein n=1 Tax=Rhipicephalus sanguineus TaxID=34632 RepID=A0A9D4PXY4_RHISA|nr:hypothetical protein HPB52_022543 [Rhipicephalus sanguineus]